MSHYTQLGLTTRMSGRASVGMGILSRPHQDPRCPHPGPSKGSLGDIPLCLFQLPAAPGIPQLGGPHRSSLRLLLHAAFPCVSSKDTCHWVEGPLQIQADLISASDGYRPAFSKVLESRGCTGALPTLVAVLVEFSPSKAALGPGQAPASFVFPSR